jgi:hypothetical protein
MLAIGKKLLAIGSPANYMEEQRENCFDLLLFFIVPVSGSLLHVCCCSFIISFAVRFICRTVPDKFTGTIENNND